MHKVYAAIELLVAAQSAAMMTKRCLLANSNSILHQGAETPTMKMFDRIHDSQKHLKNQLKEKWLIDGILAASERDDETGQIKRTSLVIESLRALAHPHGLKHAETVFSEFCKNPNISDLSDESKKEWMEGIMTVEMGLKTMLFKTEHFAEIFAIRLVGWLRGRKRHSSSKTPVEVKDKLHRGDSSAGRLA